MYEPIINDVPLHKIREMYLTAIDISSRKRIPYTFWEEFGVTVGKKPPQLQAMYYAIKGEHSRTFWGHLPIEYREYIKGNRDTWTDEEVIPEEPTTNGSAPTPPVGSELLLQEQQYTNKLLQELITTIRECWK